MLRWFALGVGLVLGCRPAPVRAPVPVSATPTRPAVVVDARPLAPAWSAEVGALYARGDAAALLATGEPFHMARAGELLAAAGDVAGARNAWARAYEGFVRRGAEVRLHWLEHSSMESLHVDGDRRVEVTWSATPEVWGPFVGEVAFGTVEGPATRSLLWPRSVRALAVTVDAQIVVHDDGGDVVVRDARSGLVIRRIDTPDEELRHLVVAGTGDAIHVLCAGDRGIGLWGPGGQRIAEYALEGTASYLVRVYRGPGTHHDNVIEHAPTWPTALAIEDDAQRVAIGAADATIVVHDRDGGAPRLLAAQFPAPTDLHSDAQQNHPIALRFTPAGLVAVHVFGDVVVWDPRTGKQLRHLAGACTAAELGRPGGGDRRGGSGGDREAREYCGVTRQAAIARSGDTVALASHAGDVRVRRIGDGATIGRWPDQAVPHGDIGISAAGEVVVTRYGGAVVTLRPDRPPRTIVAEQEESAIDQALGPGPRFSYKPVSGGHVVWDLGRGRRAPPPSEVLRIGDGYEVVQGDDRVEVRDVKTGAVRFSAPQVPEGYVTVTAAPTGQAVLTIHPPWEREELTQRHFLVDPRAGTSRALALRNGEFQEPLLSPDGRWVVTDAGELLVWDVGTGKLRHAGRSDARRPVFARDGAYLAWAEWDRAALLDLTKEGGARHVRFAADEEVRGLAFTPDGRTLWAVTQEHLARWDTRSGRHASFEIPTEYVRGSLYVDPSGKAIAVGGTFVEVYTPVGARVATLFHTTAGGWVGLSTAGAVDGSDDAPGRLVTRVARGEEVLMFEGRLGWGSLRVPGLMLRALAGEDVAPRYGEVTAR